MALGLGELAEEFDEQRELVAGGDANDGTAKKADFQWGARHLRRGGDFG
jgi:hypothetical protein